MGFSTSSTSSSSSSRAWMAMPGAFSRSSTPMDDVLSRKSSVESAPSLSSASSSEESQCSSVNPRRWSTATSISSISDDKVAVKPIPLTNILPTHEIVTPISFERDVVLTDEQLNNPPSLYTEREIVLTDEQFKRPPTLRAAKRKHQSKSARVRHHLSSLARPMSPFHATGKSAFKAPALVDPSTLTRHTTPVHELIDTDQGVLPKGPAPAVLSARSARQARSRTGTEGVESGGVLCEGW